LKGHVDLIAKGDARGTSFFRYGRTYHRTAGLSDLRPYPPGGTVGQDGGEDPV